MGKAVAAPSSLPSAAAESAEAAVVAPASAPSPPSALPPPSHGRFHPAAETQAAVGAEAPPTSSPPPLLPPRSAPRTPPPPLRTEPAPPPRRRAASGSAGGAPIEVEGEAAYRLHRPSTSAARKLGAGGCKGRRSGMGLCGSDGAAGRAAAGSPGGASVAAARRRRRRARSDLGSLSAGVGAGIEVEGESAHRLHRLCGSAGPLLGSSARRRGGRPTRWGVPPSGRSGRASGRAPPQESPAALA